MHVTSSRKEDFRAHLEAARLDLLTLNDVSATAQHVYRRHVDISRSGQNYYYLLYNHGSPWTVHQMGSGGRLLSGDMTLVDSRERYEFNFPDDFSVLSVQAPVSWLENWLPHPEALLGRRIDGQQGWGLSLGTLLRQLSPNAVGALPLPDKLLADQVGALLCLALQPESVAQQRVKPAQDLAAGIGDAIRARCTEPGLVAAAIADDLAISVRTLHRTLAMQGTTFAEMLIAERIVIAQRLLSSPAFKNLSISEIGYRVGLADPSHFTRVYKRVTGQTPKQTRTGS
ncbi:HTH-type transcriptional activator RhaS [Marinobacterium zhoushanense]|uniref:HTH-type transcriptional activator RhaS n=2 Tax=Marinobacterium zhoushanense TaxID=1679163 RepID=A0ABQ1JZK7_9GAMM|nr:HTH-type transcriptional activator RhaS [Marinobacterium zhoushanense]